MRVCRGRLRLTDHSLPCSEAESIMTEFSNILRCSGYSASFRGKVTRGKLLAGLQRIVREEGDKIGMKIKLIEQTLVLVRALLTRTDLSGCLFPDCKIEEDSCWGECIVCGAGHTPGSVSTS